MSSVVSTGDKCLALDRSAFRSFCPTFINDEYWGTIREIQKIIGATLRWTDVCPLGRTNAKILLFVAYRKELKFQWVMCVVVTPLYLLD